MNRFTRPLATAAAAAALLAVTACGGTAPAPAPAPSPAASSPAATADPVPSPVPFTGDAMDTDTVPGAIGPEGTDTAGTYWFMSADQLAAAEFTYPGTCPADLAAVLPSASCITVDVDNRYGEEGMNMYGVTFYDADGQAYRFTGPDEALSDAGADANVVNKYMQWADAGERVKFVLAYLGDNPVPDRIARAAAQPNGAFDTVEVYKDTP